MKRKEVTVVRIYLNERGSHLDNLLRRLHDWEKVRGVTVFRGISGFGNSGDMHTASLVDLSLDLPLVVEFFDEPDKAAEITRHLASSIKPDHIVSWSAWIHEQD
ncbi:MAG TPA: DUF190 domain-containing protein [Gammaproteobacteria bacterium]|nr:DUF190 domain-containing protein [Gammaproteobacteria bacterium]